MVEKQSEAFHTSVASFFLSLKRNFIAYCSSKVSSCPDCIFEIHQRWESGFSRVYSNCCCNCSFEREIIKIGQSSHKTYSNNIVNFQESTTTLNACTKKSGNLLKAPRISISLKCTHTHTHTHTHTQRRVYFNIFVSLLFFGGSLPNIMVWVLIDEFEFQSRYYVHFWTNRIGKGSEPPNQSNYDGGSNTVTTLSSTTMVLALNNPLRLICH